MQDTFFKIRQIASLVVFLIVLSFIGMITGNTIMVFAYFGFFLLMSGVVYLSLSLKQRHSEVVYKENKILRYILAAIFGIFAIILPYLIARYSSVISLPEEITQNMVIASMLGFSILFIALLVASLLLINNRDGNIGLRILGFIIFLVMAAFPGLVMSRVDQSPMGIGSVYYVALAVLILAYNSLMLFQAKE